MPRPNGLNSHLSSSRSTTRQKAKPAKPSSTSARVQLRRLIEEQMSPGDRLASEQDLAERFAVSRNTVREALEELQTLGLVRRRWGYGTFVSRNISNLRKSLSELVPISEVVRRAGKQCRLERYVYKREVLPASMRSPDLTDDFAMVWELERVYSADAIPFILLRDYLPVHRDGVTLDPSKLEESIWKMVTEQWGISFSYAIADVQAVSAPTGIASLLKIRPGAAVMKDKQFLFSSDDAVIACTASFIRTDIIALQVTRRYGPQ